MSRKALHLVVDLEIQAVTCPGVWLCPSGNVQLLFSMLGQEVQTKRLPPIFPLLFHEKLTFEKTYPSAGCLAEVQDALGREDVYAVLLQEVEDSHGGAAVQLARFHSSALHILYPSPCAKGLLAGVDVDLLMEASTDYPGILSPKIELATKTIVKEIASYIHEGHIINPKTLTSQKRIPSFRHCTEGDIRTIHSDGRYHKTSGHNPQKGKKVRNHQELHHNLGFCRSTQYSPVKVGPSNYNGHQNGHIHCSGSSGFQKASECQEQCQCGARHLASKCHLCTQYKAVFSSLSDFPELFEGKHQLTDKMRTKHENPSTFERTKRLSTALHAHVDRILEPNLGNISYERERYNPFTPLPPQELHSDLRESVHRPNKKTAEEQGSEYSHTPLSSKETYQPEPCFKVSGAGDEFNSHRQLFYANLEKFYRKLYNRAKSRRTQEEKWLGSNDQ